MYFRINKYSQMALRLLTHPQTPSLLRACLYAEGASKSLPLCVGMSGGEREI